MEEKNLEDKDKSENNDFVKSYFEWLEIDTQKKNAKKFEEITKNKKKEEL